jgi:hypothetical protein
MMDVPLSINLPAGLSKAGFARWRDSMSFVVIGAYTLTRLCLLTSTRLLCCWCGCFSDCELYFLVCTEKPVHGKLSELITVSEFMVYTPNQGNVGSFIELGKN